MKKKKIIALSLIVLCGCFFLFMIINKLQSDQTADTDMTITTEEFLEEKTELTLEKEGDKKWSVEKNSILLGKEEISQYYGVYEIKEYYPGNTESYGENRICNLPDEEADLLVGQKIILTEDKYVAYDNFRLGGRSGDRELSDYQIKKYIINNPEYTVKVSYEQNGFDFDGYPANCISNSLDYPYKLIELSNQEDLAESSRKLKFIPHLFVIDECRLMWCCETCKQWFIIEKIADTYDEEDISLATDESGKVPAEMYGSYKITEFYPTVYWKSRQNLYERGYLSSEDAQNIIGRMVFFGAKSYQGYSFDSSAFAEDPPRCESEIIAVDSENMNYLVRDVKRSELYGLRDSILPEIYEQDVYKEITVPLSMLSQDLEPPDYFCGTKYYQLDADNNKILMLFMKEFFLLEKAD